ncbi:GIY-YIG nuclease family protein [Aliiglaciecola sp. CAU 1673]|uniref:GIY-YIG nuclease family protein n=1 Tax=Aliiglaciecola sp. CAU 1673 TaxID=3032595 RepID=UPI0023DAFB8B|nr:GIY-YIG nuclease family protein [Aliiglaciecola sp. CAU 1673]MDF2180043.1 GIY-YIG nuclease family protein [Aliiglaciecola sp. CAU 1673]
MSIWHLYIIENRLGHWYTGISTDPKRRFLEHQQGNKGAKALRGKGPLKMVFETVVGDRAAASRAEAWVKGLCRRDKEKLVQGTIDLQVELQISD